MRSRLITLLLVYAIAVLPTHFAVAQQPTVSVEQLQEQIKQMEAIDRDLSLSEQTRELNRQFLNARRQQLRDLVSKRIVELRSYQTKMESALSVDEQRLLENSIQQLMAMMREPESAARTSDRVVNRPATVNTETVENNGNPLRQSESTVSDATEAGQPESKSQAPISNSRAALAPTHPVSPAPCTGSYANVPPRLDQLVEAIALLIVDKAAEERGKLPAPSPAMFAQSLAGEFERHYDEAVLLTIADALFTDTQKVSLTKLRWQQFSAETKRTDKQIGASARSEGSTSLVEKPNFSDLLSFAIEHGAIQKEVDKTSLTLSTSPYAIIASIHGDTSDVYQQYDFFNRIGISANFNLANQDNVLANASRKQLNQWSLKFRLNADRTARGKDFQDYWDNQVRPLIEKRAIVLVEALHNAFDVRSPDGKYHLEGLRRSLRDKFRGAAGYLVTVVNSTAGAPPASQTSALKAEILCRLKEEVYDPLKNGTVTVPGDFVASLNKSIVDSAAAERDLKEGHDDVQAELKRLDDKPVASFSYTNVRPGTGSYYSVFKGLYLQKAFAPMKIAVNGEFSIYHNPDPKLHQQRLRDALFSVALEGKLGRSPFVTTMMDESPITFSFTGSYQRMLENTKGTNKKADIGSGQLKLEIPVFTGFSLPVAVTYSNATEEQKKRHFRFNFGFGLDADKLAALLLAKKALNR